MCGMKRLLMCAALSMLLSVAAAGSVTAQRIAYDERTPRINPKKCKWLDDRIPMESDFVYIGFIYSRSHTCLEFCYGIGQQLERMEHPPQVILVTREPADMIDSHLRECIGERVGTIIDESGRIFRAFGVRYVPFGVLVDGRRRALWFGNPLTGDRDLFRNMPRKEFKETKKRKKTRNI